jgi:hypothetical protein
MISFTRAEIVDLIRRVQSGAGNSEDFSALERATGNPNVWIFFDVLEIEDMPPEKLFDRLNLYSEVPAC